jgi:hypothetical protein
MYNIEKIQDMRVWMCNEDDDGLCGEIWAQEGTPEFCPECSFIFYHQAKIQGKEPKVKRPVGICPLEEVRSVERRFEVFGLDIPVHIPTPIPLDLVQLSTLPREEWVGKPIFHPQGQMGDLANWHRYEIGVVIAVEPDPHFDDKVRCRFLMADFRSQSDAIAYPPNNLWTPHE